MTRQQLLKKYDSLPPAARKKVERLVTLLASSRKPATPKQARMQDFGLGDEIFGMWRDRDDMIDAIGWVRNLRRRQWGRRIGRSAD